MNIRILSYSIVAGLVVAVPLAAFVALCSVGKLLAYPCFNVFGISPKAVGVAYAVLSFCSVFFVCYSILTRGESILERFDFQKGRFGKSFTFSKRSVGATTFLIFVCWLPVVILLFPCSTTPVDTGNQLFQFFTPAPTTYMGTWIDAEFIDHHPVFDTILFGAFVSVGRALGSDALGMFAYALFQSLLWAFAMAFSVCYLDRLGVPPFIRVVAFFFATFFPNFPFNADTMQKDSIFTPFFIFFLIGCVEMVRTKGRAAGSTRFCVFFALAVLFCILTKKLGAFGVVPSVFALIVACGFCRARLLVSAAVPVFVGCVLIPMFVFPVLSVAPGGSQEMLGFCYQQSITVLKKAPQSMTEDDKKILESVLDTKAALKAFIPYKTDPVKSKARQSAAFGDYLAYFCMWARQGMMHPIIYLTSIAKCCGPLLVPSKPLGLPTEMVSKKQIEKFDKKAKEVGHRFTLDAEKPPLLKKLTDSIKTFHYDGLCTIPVLSLFLTAGFYTYWIPVIALAILLGLKKGRFAIALVPVLISSLLLLLSPTDIARYALQFAPVVILETGVVIFALRDRS